jgi:hypothetical protein
MTVSGLQPLEKLTNWVLNGQPMTDQTWHTFSQPTDTMGQFHDTPYGLCYVGAGTVTGAQLISFDKGNTTVRTNNLTFNATSPGHGRVTNGSDVDKTQ